MRNAFLLSFLVASSLAVHAQGASGIPAALTAVASHGCPVVVNAQRWASGGLVQTGKANKAPEQPTLYLHFLANGNNSIVAAKVVLHGTTAAPRAELAGGTPSSDLSESHDLDGNLGNTSVALGKLVNVRWVSVTELRYADGTTWHESGQAYCHIAPNGFRLVDATAQ